MVEKVAESGEPKKKDLKELKTSPLKGPDMAQKLLMQHLSPKNEREFVNVGQSVVMGRVGTTNSNSPLRPQTHNMEGERPRPSAHQTRNVTQGLSSINESINSKTYGVFPPKLIEDLNNEEDWKVKSVVDLVNKEIVFS